MLQEPKKRMVGQKMQYTQRTLLRTEYRRHLKAASNMQTIFYNNDVADNRRPNSIIRFIALPCPA